MPITVRPKTTLHAPDYQQRVMGTCPTCNHDLWMYYTPYCPMCEPPQPNEGPNAMSEFWGEVNGTMDKATKKKAKQNNHFCWSRVKNYAQAALGQPNIHYTFTAQEKALFPGDHKPYRLWDVILDAQKLAGHYERFGNDRLCSMTFKDEHYPDHPIVRAWTAAIREIIGADEAVLWVSW